LKDVCDGCDRPAPIKLQDAVETIDADFVVEALTETWLKRVRLDSKSVVIRPTKFQSLIHARNLAFAAGKKAVQILGMGAIDAKEAEAAALTAEDTLVAGEAQASLF
jgi:hypothetical protein